MLCCREKHNLTLGCCNAAFIFADTFQIYAQLTYSLGLSYDRRLNLIFATNKKCFCILNKHYSTTAPGTHTDIFL